MRISDLDYVKLPALQSLNASTLDLSESAEVAVHFLAVIQRLQVWCQFVPTRSRPPFGRQFKHLHTLFFGKCAQCARLHPFQICNKTTLGSAHLNFRIILQTILYFTVAVRVLNTF